MSSADNVPASLRVDKEEYLRGAVIFRVRNRPTLKGFPTQRRQTKASERQGKHHRVVYCIIFLKVGCSFIPQWICFTPVNIAPSGRKAPGGKIVNTSTEEHPLFIAGAGPLKGQRFVLDRPLVIGREPSCDIVITDRRVSRFHARVSPSPGGAMLEDLGSKNGTHRNGNRISSPVILKDGDTVQIALAQQFLFLLSDATLPLLEEPPRGKRLRLDVRSRRVWVNNQALEPPLSALQFRILQILYENEGQVVDRQEIITRAWGEQEASSVSDQALDALIRRLRDRIATADPSHAYIITVRGHGLRLDNPPLEE